VQYKFSRPSLCRGPTLRRADYQFDGIIDFGHEIDAGAFAFVQIPSNATLNSANASGWISSGLAAIEQVTDLTAGLGPRNGLHFARVEFLNSARDFF
jgi:hypothetical protein